MMYADAVASAAGGGRIPVISAPRDGKSTFDLRDLYRKELRVLGVDTRRLDAVACAKLLAQMAPRFESGQFKVSPGRPMPLAAAVQAYEQAAHRGGRILLQRN